MTSKLVRLAIFIAGLALLTWGFRLIFLDYHRPSPPRGGAFSGKAGAVLGDESQKNPYLRGRSALRSRRPPQAVTSPTPTPIALSFSIVTEDLPMGAVGEEYRQLLKAEGGSGELSWKLAEGSLPPGLELAREGVIKGTPRQDGEWSFTILVEDKEKNQARKKFRLIVRKSAALPEDSELTILTATLPDGILGRDYLQEIKTGGGKPPYGWSVVAGRLPGMILLNKEEGILYGSPRESGTFSFTIRATDALGKWVEMSYTLRIREGELKILTPVLPPAVPGREYTHQLQAEGGVPPYRWELVSGKLPPGMELGPETGIIGGTSDTIGVFKFVIRVRDFGGKEAEKEFSLSVGEAASWSASRSDQFRIVTPSLAPATRGQSYFQQLEAENGRPPYTWTVSQEKLPPSLTLESELGQIGGVPEKEGKYIFTIMVADQNRATAESQFSLFVYLQLVYITTGTLATAVIGENYQQAVEVTGGSSPYLWSMESGSLPADLALDPGSGLIHGLVSESYLAEGTQEFVFRVKATDQAGSYDIAELRLTVRKTAEPTPVPSPSTTSPPTPTPIPSPGLQITTASLSDGRVGEDYRARLSASGGVPPYVWSVTSLPDGLSSTEGGEIKGKPEKAGTYSVGVEVTDKELNSAYRFLDLTVKEPYAEGISGLIAAAGDGKVGFVWTNPAGGDFEEVVILRKTGSYPEDDQDGTVVYRGDGDNFVDDSNLTNGVAFFFGVVGYNESGCSSELDKSCLVSVEPAEVSLSGENDPFADEVISFSPLSPGGFGSEALALGAPAGAGSWEGSLDVVSLHARIYDGTSPCGGTIILKFSDNIVFDGPGDDFTVFENAFYIGGSAEKRWMEPAVVSVSQDGKNFYEFPINYVLHTHADGSVNYYNPYSYEYGFAGISPVFSNNGSPDPRDPRVSGGDSFNLSDIRAKNLSWIRYLKITSTGDNWMTDVNGDKVRHVQELGSCSGAGSSGFDLDAVCAINY